MNASKLKFEWPPGGKGCATVTGISTAIRSPILYDLGAPVKTVAVASVSELSVIVPSTVSVTWPVQFVVVIQEPHGALVVTPTVAYRKYGVGEYLGQSAYRAPRVVRKTIHRQGLIRERESCV